MPSHFTEEDEAILVALAAAAGVAIDNARLYDASRRQRDWSDAIAEITQMLLEREDEDAALALVARRVAALSRASAALVAILDEAEELRVRANTRGDGRPEASDAPTVLAAPMWREVLAAKQPILFEAADETGPPEWRRELLDLLGPAGWGATAVLPLPPGHSDIGVLVISWKVEAENLPRESMPGLTDFAQQAGLGLLAGRAQRDRALMAMLDDRDRIARDMHDHVIQRLFATGLSLQSAARMASHLTLQPRVDAAVDDIDAAIKEIRQAIYQLHRPVRSDEMSDRLKALTASFTQHLGFAPRLKTVGPLDGLGPALVSEVLAVVREGLANASKYSGAAGVDVSVTVDDESVCVVVVDDGQGVDPSLAKGGLVNLAERAAARNGTFELFPDTPRGTLLRWSVPR